MDHSEEIAHFSAVTGADQPTAEHFLAASNWDLNSSINFYVESGSATAFAGGSSISAGHEQPQGYQYAQAQTNLPDTYDDQPRPRRADPAHHPGSTEDEELQAALAASLHTTGHVQRISVDWLPDYLQTAVVKQLDRASWQTLGDASRVYEQPSAGRLGACAASFEHPATWS